MKFIKELTAVVLSIALALTSMTAVFATDSATVANADKAATLKDLGLYAGTNASNVAAGLDGALTTQDSLIFLSRMFGYNEAADALTADEVTSALAKFDDASLISNYAKNVVAYSAANNILSGSTQDGKFFVGSKDTVTAARFATFMLREMGYTVPDYKASVAMLAEKKGSSVAATITGDLTRDDAVGVMYGALTAEKANGKMIIDDIVGNSDDLKAIAEKAGLLEPPIYEDVAVESVQALNAKQIEIIFNQQMNKASVENESFYEIFDNGSDKIVLGDSSALLYGDRKTVSITLNKNVADKLTNGSYAKVTVKSGIKPANRAALAEPAVFDKVQVRDVIIPTVVNVKATGERNIRVTFSEPVYDKGKDTSIATTNFKVVSGTYSYHVEKATLDNNAIDLKLGTTLIEGPVTVTVNDAGYNVENAIADYAGYRVFKESTTFNYVNDTSVPVVTVKSASADRVVLHFSKPVKGSNIKLYHSSKNASSYLSTATTADYVNDIGFSYGDENKLPTGAVKLYLVNSDNEKQKIVDGYGVKVPDQAITCYVAEEIILPEPEPEPEPEQKPASKHSHSSSPLPVYVNIEKAQLTAADQITIVLSEWVPNIAIGDIVLTDLTTSGSISVSRIEPTHTNEGKTEAVLSLDGELSTDVKDAAGASIGIATIATPASVSVRSNRLASGLNLSLEDRVAPEILGISTSDPQCDGSSTGGSITFLFSEAIDPQSVTSGSFVVSPASEEHEPSIVFTVTGVKANADAKTVELTIEARDTITSNTPPVEISLAKGAAIRDIVGNQYAPDQNQEPWIVRFSTLQTN